MATYIAKRLFVGLWLLVLVSVVAFIVIELPPGDFVNQLIARMETRGQFLSDDEAHQLRTLYGLNDPFIVRYAKWMSGVMQGNFGFSLEHYKPVRELIGERLLLTTLLSIATIAVTYLIAVPVGVYSAIRRYSVFDYTFTLLGFVGLAIPNFLLALLLMYVGNVAFGFSMGGLFSSEYLTAPWSWAKFVNMLTHLWVPIIVVGTAGTAASIRIMRAMMTDELNKPYIMVVRAKGVPEQRVVWRHALRVAINPLVSTAAWLLPVVVSGDAIVATVLGLPTAGNLLLTSLLSQDVYLAGTLIMFLSVLTVIGTLLSDIALAALDPRIRQGI